MITEAEIENYRGIKHCKIEGLTRINLFVGKNNCGKSNILEAIYLVGKEYLVPSLQEILGRRSNRSSIRELWYKYEIDKEIKLSEKFDGEPLDLIIRYQEPQVFALVRLSPDRDALE